MVLLCAYGGVELLTLPLKNYGDRDIPHSVERSSDIASVMSMTHERQFDEKKIGIKKQQIELPFTVIMPDEKITAIFAIQPAMSLFTFNRDAILRTECEELYRNCRLEEGASLVVFFIRKGVISKISTLQGRSHADKTPEITDRPEKAIKIAYYLFQNQHFQKVNAIFDYYSEKRAIKHSGLDIFHEFEGFYKSFDQLDKPKENMGHYLNKAKESVGNYLLSTALIEPPPVLKDKNHLLLASIVYAYSDKFLSDRTRFPIYNFMLRSSYARSPYTGSSVAPPAYFVHEKAERLVGLFFIAVILIHLQEQQLLDSRLICLCNCSLSEDHALPANCASNILSECYGDEVPQQLEPVMAAISALPFDPAGKESAALNFFQKMGTLEDAFLSSETLPNPFRQNTQALFREGDGFTVHTKDNDMNQPGCIQHSILR